MSSKYIFQLRRGWKDSRTGRNDWANYEIQEDHIKPLPGELVVEYDNGVPRLKIGDGVNEFSALPYMSVDSFILPSPTTITLFGGSEYWLQYYDENDNLIGYYQRITEVSNGIITENSKIDLQPSPEQLSIFYEKDVTFTVVNEGGVAMAYATGVRPEQDYTIQCTITEVSIDG
jgi:hypothetical protein